MALTPGSRFGCYEIAGEIGAGGMGVVYRATDTNLKRDVAIKVLPDSLAEDEERLARFQREAELLASLNHANIATIHGLEKVDGATALVMELVEGPTLEDRIKNGALNADDALGLAMQITAALEAAHGQGIVHRDLKPANIKLGSDGTLKVLDFGIAKALEPDVVTSAPQSPIMTTPATQVGVILGTAAYMSPEQAKGKFVDQRTDIWAFGCLLYEMLTGQMAFGAEDVPTTLARVIDRDTDLDTLPAALSPAVRSTIRLCLQKDVSKRVSDIRDVRLALEGAFDTGDTLAAEVVAASRPIWRRALPVGAAVLVTAIVVGSVAWVSLQPEPLAVNRFDFDLPEGQSFGLASRRVLALSPDGRHFVYNSGDGLYLRSMDELEARLIAGTESGYLPAFSPDGQSLVYASEPGELRRISISGGAPVVIGQVPLALGGTSWAVDDTVFFSYGGQGILRVPAVGGMPEVVIPSDDDRPLFYGPELLPDGDSVVFSIAGADWDTAQIVLQSLSTGERTVLVEGGSDARYLPTGHLVYALGDGLVGVRFDLDSLTVSGGAVPLVQGVMRAGPTSSTASANYGVSEDGTLVYVAGSVAVLERTLVWVDREGRESPLAVPPRAYVNPQISPDGTKLALDVRDQELDIWVWDLLRQALTRLTFGPAQDEFPVWSPDGQRIAYASTGGADGTASVGLLWRAADGTGSAERLAVAANNGQLFPTSFLPDATGILVFGTTTGANGDDIGVFRFDSEEGATPLLDTTFEESYPAVSPDGRWLAYVSNESGNEEIYVRPFPETDEGRWQVSTGGGTQPLWASDGQELFYRSSDGVTAVAVQTDPAFVAATPEELFQGDYLLANGGPNYDVAADGERFLMIKSVENPSETPQIVIVQNWFEELERLVPAQ